MIGQPEPHLAPGTALVHCGVLAGVEGWGGLVGLARGAVEGHHPVVRILKRDQS